MNSSVARLREGFWVAVTLQIAKDAIARLMANPDVQNMGESIRTGALKVRLLHHWSCRWLERCNVESNNEYIIGIPHVFEIADEKKKQSNAW